MRKGQKIIGITPFYNFSSDFLHGACGDADYSLEFYAKKTGIKISDFQTNRSMQENPVVADTGMSSSEEIKKVAKIVELASAEEEKSFRKEKENQEEEWKPPEDLSRPLPPAPEFPSECLPDSFRNYVLDVANRYQCPADMVAIPLMISTAGLIGAKVAIRPKQNDNWSERCCLWGTVIGTKGSVKSPAMAEGTKNIRRIQDRLRTEYRDEIREWKRRRDEAKVGNDKTKSDPNNSAFTEPKPKKIRIVVTDITVEKLVDLMWDSRGLAMVHDELAGFVLNLCRYHNGSDRQFYLQTHSGGGYDLDRITRGEQYVSDLYLNIVGLIQPSVAKVIFGEDEGDDGLFERFGLIAYPEKPKRFKLVDEAPNEEAYEMLRMVSDRLYGAVWDTLLSQDNYDSKPFVRFDAEAQNLFNEWYEAHMNRLLKMDDDLLGGFYAKGQGLLARLVLLTHLTKWAENEEAVDIKLVSKDTLRMCINFFQNYLAPMWKRISIGFSMSTTDVTVQKIANWIKENGVKRVTIREIKRKNWKDLGGDEEILEAISELKKINWLGAMVVGKTRGRNSKYFPANPLIWDE